MTIAIRVSTILILFCALVIATYPVWAQESTSTPTQSGSTGTTRKDRVKDRVETRKENVKERVATLKERMATREAALKEKLQKFRDQKKAQITERVSNNLNKINANHTNHMLRFLENASKILTKLEERVNQGTADVKDPALAKQAIADAKAAIEKAKAAVQTQADKDYTVTVTSESKVRTEVKSVRDSLHTDLRSLREQVIAAKQAVANAIRVAKSGKVESPSTSSGLKEATRSGQ